MPGRLRRRALHDELTALAADADADPVLLAEPAPVLRVRTDGAASDPVQPSHLVCCDLTDWHRPADDRVAVDPMLGRLALPRGSGPARVLVDYAYGFPGDLGAGPYDRRETLAMAQAATGLTWPDELAWRDGRRVAGRGKPRPRPDAGAGCQHDRGRGAAVERAFPATRRSGRRHRGHRQRHLRRESQH